MRTSSGLETAPLNMTVRSSVGSNIPPITQHLPPKVVDVPKDAIKSFTHTKRVGNYLLGRTLGEGSFAKVKEGLHVITGEKVAVKVVDKKRARDDAYVRKNMRREGKLLQMVQHPNIVRLLEIMETENSYYMVTGLCRGGDFMEYICQKKKLEEREVKKYLRQIISAIDHLHRLGILHRDLKVENLLLDENKDIKIIDFGLSNTVKGRTCNDGQKMQDFCVTQCGSPAYAAPELLGHKNYGPQVDVWSIGINMYAMLTGNLPFTVDPFNIKVLHNKMLNGQMNPIPEHLSKDCKDLLKKLLNPDPEMRISLADAMSHPWITDGKTKPMEASSCPNRVRSEDLNENILHHMTDFHGYRMSDVIRHVTSNIPGPIVSLYHLFSNKLNKYNCDQRRRGEILTVDVKNHENKKLSVVFQKDAAMGAKRVVTGPNNPTHPDTQVTHPHSHHNERTELKEEKLEPKIIQLQIPPGVSFDLPMARKGKNGIKRRVYNKAKRPSEVRHQAAHGKELKNDVVLKDVTQLDTAKKTKDSINEKILHTQTEETQKPSISFKSPNDKVAGGKLVNTCTVTENEQRDKNTDSDDRGSKTPTVHLSKRYVKRHDAGRNNHCRVAEICSSAKNTTQSGTGSVDNNNNNSNVILPKNADGLRREVVVCTGVPKFRQRERQYNSVSDSMQSSRLSPKVALGTQSPRPEAALANRRHTLHKMLNIIPTRKSTPSHPEVRTCRGAVIADEHASDDKRLLDIAYTPFTRKSGGKSVSFRHTQIGLENELANPRQMLIEKCGGIVSKSKTSVSSGLSKKTSTGQGQGRQVYETESIEPFSPESSTGSKSSRSTVNQSDRSTKSSNLALPSISPTFMMRNN